MKHDVDRNERSLPFLRAQTSMHLLLDFDRAIERLNGGDPLALAQWAAANKRAIRLALGGDVL